MTMTTPLSRPRASTSASWLQATRVKPSTTTEELGSGKARGGSASARFQNDAGPRMATLVSVNPLGAKAIDVTMPSWPSRYRMMNDYGLVKLFTTTTRRHDDTT